MAKFRYRMQNILEIKEKMEEQEKIAYGIANAKLVEEQEKAGKALVIRPSEPITISRTENNPEKLEEVYQLGRKDGQKNLEKMKIFLKTSRAGIPE